MKQREQDSTAGARPSIDLDCLPDGTRVLPSRDGSIRLQERGQAQRIEASVAFANDSAPPCAIIGGTRCG